MLKFKQQTASRPQSRQSNVSDLSTMKLEPCKATVVIKNISLPLAWPAAEYFEHRGDLRDFNVCLSFKAAGGKLLRSRVYQRVNRTMPDIKFDEHFTFTDLSPDFTIEAMITAKRVDGRSNHHSSSTFTSVSRSFGKKFGAAFKKYNEKPQGNYTISAINFADDAFKSAVDQLIPVGRCFFRIENAGLSGKIRIYSLTLVQPEIISVNFDPADLVPLFGTIACQVLCRPDCLTTTLIRSCLDIFYIDEELLLERLNCGLQNGMIKCYTQNDAENPGLVLPIDKRTKVRPTAYKTSFRITLFDDSMTYSKEFMFILQNPMNVTDWITAIRQQISDAEAWGDFASISTNPLALANVRDSPTYLYDGNNNNGESTCGTMSSKGRTVTSTTQYQDNLRRELHHGTKERKSVKNVFRNDGGENQFRGFANNLLPPDVAVVVERRESKEARPRLEDSRVVRKDKKDVLRELPSPERVSPFIKEMVVKKFENEPGSRSTAVETNGSGQYSVLKTSVPGGLASRDGSRSGARSRPESRSKSSELRDGQYSVLKSTSEVSGSKLEVRADRIPGVSLNPESKSKSELRESQHSVLKSTSEDSGPKYDMIPGLPLKPESKSKKSEQRESQYSVLQTTSGGSGARLPESRSDRSSGASSKPSSRSKSRDRKEPSKSRSKSRERPEMERMTHVEKVDVPPPLPKHRPPPELPRILKPGENQSIKSTGGSKQRMKLVFEPLDFNVDQKLVEINKQNEVAAQKASQKVQAPVQKSKNETDLKSAAPKNTYVIRLNIGSTSDDDEISESRPKSKKQPVYSTPSPSSSSTTSSMAENKPPPPEWKRNDIREVKKKVEHRPQMAPPPAKTENLPGKNKVNNPKLMSTPVTRSLLQPNGDVFSNKKGENVEITRL